MTIVANFSLRQPDGSWANSRLEIADDDRWPELLDRLEARFGPAIGNPPLPLDPTVAAVLANPAIPPNPAEASPGASRHASRAVDVGSPIPYSKASGSTVTAGGRSIAISESSQEDSEIATPATGVRETSRDALHRHQASGKLGKQEMLVFGFVRGHSREDFTRQEIAQALGMGINAVTGRVFSIIHEHKLFRETGRRICRVTGESVMAITAVEAP